MQAAVEQVKMFDKGIQLHIGQAHVKAILDDDLESTGAPSSTTAPEAPPSEVRTGTPDAP